MGGEVYWYSAMPSHADDSVRLVVEANYAFTRILILEGRTPSFSPDIAVFYIDSLRDMFRCYPPMLVESDILAMLYEVAVRFNINTKRTQRYHAIVRVLDEGLRTIEYLRATRDVSQVTHMTAPHDAFVRFLFKYIAATRFVGESRHYVEFVSDVLTCVRALGALNFIRVDEYASEIAAASGLVCYLCSDVLCHSPNAIEALRALVWEHIDLTVVAHATCLGTLASRPLYVAPVALTDQPRRLSLWLVFTQHWPELVPTRYGARVIEAMYHMLCDETHRQGDVTSWPDTWHEIRQCGVAPLATALCDFARDHASLEVRSRALEICENIYRSV